MKIGIDLGGSHLGLGVIDEENNIVQEFEKYFNEEEKKDIITVIENYIVKTVKEVEEKYEIEEIGIAIPGIAKNGVILRTVNLGINNYDIAKSLKEKLGTSVKVRNDAKCACLAEYNNMLRNNKISKDENMLFLTIGTGIGGGVIYNGKLLEGKQFEGYEFGHMVIKENGILCKCGKCGCFERYGSILEYKNKVKERLNISSDINSDPLRKIMEDRKEEISDIYEEYVKDLAIRNF